MLHLLIKPADGGSRAASAQFPLPGWPLTTNVCGREMKGTDLDNFNKSLAPGTQTNVA